MDGNLNMAIPLSNNHELYHQTDAHIAAEMEMPSASAQEDNEQPKLGKRNLPRVSRACDACRVRKVKCDTDAANGKKCSHCASFNIECQFSIGQRKRGRKNPAIAAIRAQQESDVRPETNATEKQPLQQLASAAAASPRSRRVTDVEGVAPMEIINCLNCLYIDYLQPMHPIIDVAAYRKDLLERRDKHDSRFYALVLSICAATCVACAHLPFSTLMAQHYSSWVEAGRAFNAALPPNRTRNMFKDRDVIVIQTIMMVAVYERALGGSLEQHLMAEAMRFFVAFGFTSEDDETVSVRDMELRRRIFWILFCWDKCHALQSRRPMFMRSDEMQMSMLTEKSEDSISYLGDHWECPGVATFIKPICIVSNMHLATEAAILQFHKDARLRGTHGHDPLASLYEYVDAIKAPRRNAPIVFTFPPTPHSREIYDNIPSPWTKDILGASRVALYLVEQHVVMESFHRYLPLLSPIDRHDMNLNIIEIAQQLVRNLNDIPSHSIDMLGPLAADMLFRCRDRLVDAASQLGDDARQRVQPELDLYDMLFERVDLIRQQAREELQRSRANEITSQQQQPQQQQSQHDGNNAIYNGGPSPPITMRGAPDLNVHLPPMNISPQIMHAPYAHSPTYPVHQQIPEGQPSLQSLYFVGNLPLMEVPYQWDLVPPPPQHVHHQRQNRMSM